MTALRARAVEVDHRITGEEFEQMPEFADGLHELIEGKIVKKAMPGDEHGAIVRQIVKQLIKHDPDEKLGLWWTNTSFDLDRWWKPIPDFGFVVAGRVTPIRKGAVNVIPDLVVEVHSPQDLTTLKKREKAAEKISKYQFKGVRIIWAINPSSKTVAVYHPTTINSAPLQILDINGELDGEDVIPGFKMKVADLFK